MGIPIFNRVSKISYRYRDVQEILLDREDVASMGDLKTISVSKLREGLDESDVSRIGEMVPPCRLAAVDAAKNDVNVKLKPGLTFTSCSAPERTERSGQKNRRRSVLRPLD